MEYTEKLDQKSLLLFSVILTSRNSLYHEVKSTINPLFSPKKTFYNSRVEGCFLLQFDGGGSYEVWCV